MLFSFCRHALNVQIFLKMHRSDYAERQLRAMQQIDEDHTLTQLANAWLNLAVVCIYVLFLVALHERLVCSYALFRLIRVVPRYRKHISSFKISLRSIQWQGWSWMERLFAACIWGILMKLKDCCLMHSTRQVLNSKCISYGWEFLKPGWDGVCFLLLGP